MRRAGTCRLAAATLALVTLILAPRPALAQIPAAATPGAACQTRVDAIGALVDNDSFVGRRRDGGYSSGVRIDVAGGFAAARSGLDDRVESLLGSGLDIPCTPSRAGAGDRSWFVAQEIYTPQEITEAAPQPLDRPWAGLLTLGRGWESVGLRGNALVARRLELALSVVGDASLGRQSQRLAHRWISGDEPMGWDNQLRNRWGLSLSYLERQRWRLAPAAALPTDLITHWGLSLGQIVTQARAGAMLRFGDHGCTLATPGLVTQPIALSGSAAPDCAAANTADSAGQAGPSGRHSFAFLGLDLRRVLRQQLIEGSPRSGENLVSAEPWVGDLRLGYAIGRRDWTLSYTLIRRTAEFRQHGGDKCCGQTYATISLALTW